MGAFMDDGVGIEEEGLKSPMAASAARFMRGREADVLIQRRPGGAQANRRRANDLGRAVAAGVVDDDALRSRSPRRALTLQPGMALVVLPALGGDDQDRDVHRHTRPALTAVRARCTSTPTWSTGRTRPGIDDRRGTRRTIPDAGVRLCSSSGRAELILPLDQASSYLRTNAERTHREGTGGPVEPAAATC